MEVMYGTDRRQDKKNKEWRGNNKRKYLGILCLFPERRQCQSSEKR